MAGASLLLRNVGEIMDTVEYVEYSKLFCPFSAIKRHFLQEVFYFLHLRLYLYICKADS